MAGAAPSVTAALVDGNMQLEAALADEAAAAVFHAQEPYDRRGGAGSSSSSAGRLSSLGPWGFERIQLLGRGDVGKVYLVREKDTGKLYSMKVLSKSEMIARNKVLRSPPSMSILSSFFLNATSFMCAIDVVGQESDDGARNSCVCRPPVHCDHVLQLSDRGALVLRDGVLCGWRVLPSSPTAAWSAVERLVSHASLCAPLATFLSPSHSLP